MTAATDQISVNEMRRYFHLKQQPVHFDGKNEEEPATPGNYSKEALEYFQKKDQYIHYTMDLPLSTGGSCPCRKIFRRETSRNSAAIQNEFRGIQCDHFDRVQL